MRREKGGGDSKEVGGECNKEIKKKAIKGPRDQERILDDRQHQLQAKSKG